jgi:hypothetical protein
MGWQFGFLEDGDDADESSLNTAFAAARVFINDLDGTSTRRETFNHHHSATVLDAASVALASPGLLLTGDDGIHTYTLATFLGDITYTSFAADTGTDISESHAGPSAKQWVVVGHPDQTTGGYGDGTAKVTFSGAGIDLATTGLKHGVLVLFNCDVHSYEPKTADTVEVGFCIQYKRAGGATWYTLGQTERFMLPNEHILLTADLSEKIQYDVPIATLITKARLDEEGGSGNLTGIRAMVTLKNPHADSELKLTRWNLSVIPLRMQLGG